MGANYLLPLPTRRRSSTNRAAPCSLLAPRFRGHPAAWPLRGLAAYMRCPPGVPMPRGPRPVCAPSGRSYAAPPSPSQARAVAPDQGKREQSRRQKAACASVRRGWRPLPSSCKNRSKKQRTPTPAASCALRCVAPRCGAIPPGVPLSPTPPRPSPPGEGSARTRKHSAACSTDGACCQ